MSIKSNLVKAGALGVVVTALSAGAAFAAVATTAVNVRTGPSTSYRVVDTLRPGERVNIVRRSHGWCAVTKAGPDGWVSCAYLERGVRYRPAPPPPRVNFSFGFGYPWRPMDNHHHHRWTPPPPPSHHWHHH